MTFVEMKFLIFSHCWDSYCTDSKHEIKRQCCKWYPDYSHLEKCHLGQLPPRTTAI